MIQEITGVIIATENQLLTVQPHGTGIGFGVLVPQKEPYSAGKEVKLLTYMHWNQEQGPTLYGFTSQLERKVFLLLISCSGIGPKTALVALETVSPELFLQAVFEENISVVSSIPGIGKKKAEQLIVNLKHKVQDLIDTGLSLEADSPIKHWQQITEVLTSLNYSRQEITQAIQYIKNQNESPQVSFDILLRKTLSFLSKLH